MDYDVPFPTRPLGLFGNPWTTNLDGPPLPAPRRNIPALSGIVDQSFGNPLGLPASAPPQLNVDQPPLPNFAPSLNNPRIRVSSMVIPPESPTAPAVPPAAPTPSPGPSDVPLPNFPSGPPIGGVGPPEPPRMTVMPRLDGQTASTGTGVPLPEVLQGGAQNFHGGGTPNQFVFDPASNAYVNQQTGQSRPLWASDPTNPANSPIARYLDQFRGLQGTTSYGPIAEHAGANVAALGNMGVNQGQLALGNQRLALDSDIARGTGGVPGSIANNALEAWARAYNAQNTPRAEDVQADQAAEAHMQNLMRTRGLDEAGAIAEMRRTGQRLSRRMGGGAQNQGLPPIPAWLQPPQTTSGTPPNTGGPPIPTPTATAGRGLFRNQPGVTQPQDTIASSAAMASGLIPMVAGPNGQQRNPYSGQTSSAYHNAIATFLGGIPDDVLRTHWPQIQARLTGGEFGGPQAWQDFLDTNALTALGSRANRNVLRQRDRIGQAAGMDFGPVTPFTSQDVGLLTRALSAVPAVWAPNKLLPMLWR